MVAQTLVLRHDHAQSAAAAGDEQRTDAEHAPRYVHIKTPLRQGRNTMNRYDIVGMIFGSGCAPLDLTFLSYTYEASLPALYPGPPACPPSIDRNGNAGQLSQYYGSDGTLVLKFGPVNRYCIGFSVSYQGHYQNAEDGLGEYSVTFTAEDSRI
jgi:hypothetical protein